MNLFSVSLAALLSSVLLSSSLMAGEFRVLPYLQNPSSTTMTVRWLSESESPGTLRLEGPDRLIELTSEAVAATALVPNPFREEPEAPHPPVPWLQTVRLDSLTPGTQYRYSVTQGNETHSAGFRTAPENRRSVRLIVYSDSETEPESSTAAPVAWPVSLGSNRPDQVLNYLTNQTDGYRANCREIRNRRPDLLLISGDLVECGGEQRDWDEFWRHNAGEYNALAGEIPILPALGNHENYGGPGGGYSAEAANFATDKYLTYFEVPDNSATDPKHKGRYYRLDYGRVTVITLDSSDGLPHKSASDTNHNLEGSHAPDFNPGSEQYHWLEQNLADAQQKGQIVFVQFHHTMFGSGPHSVPFGREGFSGQAGLPMRVVLPLLMKYGVALVFSGHDELLERSRVSGFEVTAEGTMREHTIHLYDVGIGGDGLRGPATGFDNPNREFLAHDHFPERWENGRLVSGGKHYGHLEINVSPHEERSWMIDVSPVHVFPVVDQTGRISEWERRLFPDPIRLEIQR